MMQDRLLYFPDTPPITAVVATAQRDSLAPWPAIDDYRGLLREPAGSADAGYASNLAGGIRGTLILFHGNAGHAGHRAWLADEFSRRGLRVILAEYPGYGPRPGKLGEASLVADAVQTIALARRQFSGPLLLAGESLGAGVAAAALAQSPRGIAAIVLITPWDTLEHVARHHYPWAPVGWLLRDRYDSIANLAAYLAASRGRIAVVVAAQDSIVPPRLGHALYDALPAAKSPKRLWVVPAADHNDWSDRVDPMWWQSLTNFLLGENQASEPLPQQPPGPPPAR